MGQGPLARNVRHIGRIDVPGGGQVAVDGQYAYVGHMAPPDGTSIIDVSDPANPRLVARIEVPLDTHSHKVRVHGDLMLVNSENYSRHLRTAGQKLPEAEAKLRRELGRDPTEAELAAAVGYEAQHLSAIREAAVRGYDSGGLRVYDITDRASPREIAFFRTGGNGVHRFDFDGRYAYLSTRLDGYVGNIVMIVDLAKPDKPEEISRWWLPGQWTAGGESPDWGERRVECHHPMRFGDRLYVSYHAGGVVLLDVSDLSRPKMISHYNYHPPFVSSSHTFVPMPHKLKERDIAVVVDEQPGRPRPEQVPAFMWVFDMSDETQPTPISTFSMKSEDTPWRHENLGPLGRFGAHQCHERMTDSLVYLTWFRGGLRICDLADPTKPTEVGFYIPEPGAGQKTVQSNDVFVDERGLIYIIDRLRGLDIVEYTPQ